MRYRVSGRVLNLVLMAGTVVNFVVFLVLGAVAAERVREDRYSHWHAAFLVAPCIQITLVGVSLAALVVAVRRRRHSVEAVVGTAILLLMSGIIIQGGVSEFQRYSWVSEPSGR